MSTDDEDDEKFLEQVWVKRLNDPVAQASWDKKMLRFMKELKSDIEAADAAAAEYQSKGGTSLCDVKKELFGALNDTE